MADEFCLMTNDLTGLNCYVNDRRRLAGLQK
jgi:hypothetical protein